MRRVLLVLSTVGIMAAAPPKKTTMDPKERAYTLTLMCVAVAASDQKESDGLRSINAARKMGKAIGHSEKRVSDDIWTMVNVVGDQLHSKPSSLNDRREICRRMQLAS